MMSPNTNPARNLWAEMFETELPKIGIGVKDHFSSGWAQIWPRFQYDLSNHIPLYDDGGYDIMFLSYLWDLDWDPRGLFDLTDSHTGERYNLYNFEASLAQRYNQSLTSDVRSLVHEYLRTIDFSARISVVEALQDELHEYVPVIPIVHPKSIWGHDRSVENLDFLLLSVNALEWEKVTGEPGTYYTCCDLPTYSLSSSEVTIIPSSTESEFQKTSSSELIEHSIHSTQTSQVPTTSTSSPFVDFSETSVESEPSNSESLSIINSSSFNNNFQGFMGIMGLLVTFRVISPKRRPKETPIEP